MRTVKLDVVILAAGAGTRMRSKLPKVLHPLGGRPLLCHVVDTTSRLEPVGLHVVVGAGAEHVQEAVDDRRISWVLQAEQLGTGHAVQQAMPRLADDAVVLVLYADVPLVSEATLRRVVECAGDGLAVVTVTKQDPRGLGRIVRGDDGRINRIVEERDADEAERAITEINTGIMAAPGALLGELLDTITPDNDQGEYYLTDIVAAANGRGAMVQAVPAQSEQEVLGVNDRAQLAILERHYQETLAAELMHGGVTLADPRRIDVRGSLRTGEDCFIDVDVVFQGEVVLGDNVRIGSGCVIIDSMLGDDTVVHPQSIIEGAKVGANCSIGPFARLRPDTELDDEVRIGNFVETKKARLGKGTKASHLAYLGDATLGDDVNVGAGTITCNYDGVDKHPTTIGDSVFVGTNSTLVAPVTIEDDAYIGAGSTITKRVEKQSLAIGRGRQRNIEGWKPPAKRKDTSKKPSEER